MLQIEEPELEADEEDGEDDRENWAYGEVRCCGLLHRLSQTAGLQGQVAGLCCWPLHHTSMQVRQLPHDHLQ